MGRKMAGQSRGTSGKSGFPEKGNTGSYSAYQQSAGMHFNHEVDLRGMRGSDALSELEKLMDRALMLGVEKLRIIHGKGDGILRKLIRNYLQEYSQLTRSEERRVGKECVRPCRYRCLRYS